MLWVAGKKLILKLPYAKQNQNEGITLFGQMALENGLVDKIGGQSEVEEYLKEKIGEDEEICW